MGASGAGKTAWRAAQQAAGHWPSAVLLDAAAVAHDPDAIGELVARQRRALAGGRDVILECSLADPWHTALIEAAAAAGTHTLLGYFIGTDSPAINVDRTTRHCGRAAPAEAEVVRQWHTAPDVLGYLQGGGCFSLLELDDNSAPQTFGRAGPAPVMQCEIEDATHVSAHAWRPAMRAWCSHWLRWHGASLAGASAALSQAAAGQRDEGLAAGP